jgi:hypothetical protein
MIFCGICPTAQRLIGPRGPAPRVDLVVASLEVVDVAEGRRADHLHEGPLHVGEVPRQLHVEAERRVLLVELPAPGVVVLGGRVLREGAQPLGELRLVPEAQPRGDPKILSHGPAF